MNEANIPLFIVLLLGSYDPDTKDLMNAVKLKVAEKFGGENTYIVLLDELDIFIADQGFALAEHLRENEAEVLVFTHAGNPVEQFTVQFKDVNVLKEKVCSKILQLLEARKCKMCEVLEKLKVAMDIASAIIVIRDREETHGGEIAELMYGVLAGFKDKICLFKKEGIYVSNMLMEFLDYFNVNIRTYRFRKDLPKEVLRYISYKFKERSKTLSSLI